MRKKYEITIWHWKTILHKGTYEFSDPTETCYYELGLFDGFRLAGKEPTGSSCKPLKNERNG